MSKVPFKVSARAARLIGRENVATSQGAVTELVKNAYDADASVCAVLFLPRWEAVPEWFSTDEYVALRRFLPDAEEIITEVEGRWYPKAELTMIEQVNLMDACRRVLTLWIIDNGHGMSTAVIQNNWMVIGTDTKELNGRSVGGRVVTGAKGIGRFALDRLGQECEMFSAVSKGGDIAHWLVDWSDFEGSGKIITDVEAVLESEPGNLPDIYKDQGVGDLLPSSAPKRLNKVEPIDFSSGTAIKIGLLNDVWDQRDSLRLKETLEALLPPHDRGDFDIFIYDHRATDHSGFIDNFPPDQFDYCMLADVEDGNVKVTLHRQEIDVNKIRSTVFTLEPMKTPPFQKADFERGYVTYEKTLSDLLGINNDNQLDNYLSIGNFSFTFYFFKLANPSSENLKRFPQKHFDLTARRRWLSNSGGIRLYRDNFRVRPYGEPKTPAYDWLLLGERTARNPAQASRLGWRVPPQQIAGTIHISKDGNPALADQSNREGIMNERAFSAFREIVVALIREFERDRAYILQQFSAAYDKDNPEPKDVEEGRKIAEKVLKSKDAPQIEPEKQLFPKAKDSVSEKDDGKAQGEHELHQVSQAYNSEVKKNEELRDNIQVMRGMATLGTVLISFTHELKQLKANIDSRSDRLADAIRDVISEEKLAEVGEIENPFRIIDRLRQQDEKVSRWVNFALSAVSPAKRRRRAIDLKEYVKGMQSYWEGFLQSKSIELRSDIEHGANLTMLAHEIDLDSVFYNLINNSVEALVQPSSSTSREIEISIRSGEKGRINILYKDNGPGLDAEEFTVADDIFMFGATSKKEESSGDAVGTGLGMWLLNNVVHDYGGSVFLPHKLGQPGFAIQIEFPAHEAVV